MMLLSVLSTAMFLATVLVITIIADLIRDKFEVKVFFCLFIALTFYWAQTSIDVANDTITCSIKEKK